MPQSVDFGGGNGPTECVRRDGLQGGPSERTARGRSARAAVWALGCGAAVSSGLRAGSRDAGPEAFPDAAPAPTPQQSQRTESDRISTGLGVSAAPP